MVTKEVPNFVALVKRIDNVVGGSDSGVWLCLSGKIVQKTFMFDGEIYTLTLQAK